MATSNWFKLLITCVNWSENYKESCSLYNNSHSFAIKFNPDVVKALRSLFDCSALFLCGEAVSKKIYAFLKRTSMEKSIDCERINKSLDVAH